MNTKTHTAKRLTKRGGVPVYEYRGHRIVSDSSGWAYYTDREHHATTLQAAKWFIDYAIEDEAIGKRPAF